MFIAVIYQYNDILTSNALRLNLRNVKASAVWSLLNVQTRVIHIIDCACYLIRQSYCYAEITKVPLFPDSVHTSRHMTRQWKANHLPYGVRDYTLLTNSLFASTHTHAHTHTQHTHTYIHTHIQTYIQAHSHTHMHVGLRRYRCSLKVIYCSIAWELFNATIWAI